MSSLIMKPTRIDKPLYIRTLDEVCENFEWMNGSLMHTKIVAFDLTGISITLYSRSGAALKNWAFKTALSKVSLEVLR